MSTLGGTSWRARFWRHDLPFPVASCRVRAGWYASDVSCCPIASARRTMRGWDPPSPSTAPLLPMLSSSTSRSLTNRMTPLSNLICPQPKSLADRRTNALQAYRGPRAWCSRPLLARLGPRYTLQQLQRRQAAGRRRDATTRGRRGCRLGRCRGRGRAARRGGRATKTAQLRRGGGKAGR